MAQTAAPPLSSSSIRSNPGRSCAERLCATAMQAEDKYAACLYSNWAFSLQQGDCRYVQLWTCADCATAYKRWLCGTVFQRCSAGDPESRVLMCRDTCFVSPFVRCLDQAFHSAQCVTETASVYTSLNDILWLDSATAHLLSSRILNATVGRQPCHCCPFLSHLPSRYKTNTTRAKLCCGTSHVTCLLNAVIVHKAPTRVQQGNAQELGHQHTVLSCRMWCANARFQTQALPAL